MSNELALVGDDGPKAVVEFFVADGAAADLVKQSFPDEEILESDAFTGAQTVIVIVSATRHAIGALLEFFALHRQSYKDATVKIGRDEISLKGYTSEEVRSLLDSPALQKLLKELRKP